MKHNWHKNEDGAVDEFAWSEGFHNGVFCEDCGYAVCVICNPNYDDDESCPGPSAPRVRGKVQIQRKTIRETAYEKYKLLWMIAHSFTLSDLIRYLQDRMQEAAEHCDISLPLSELFDEWESEEGFSGSIWPCFGEFLDAEYQDERLIKILLTKSEFACYLKEKKGKK